MNVYTVTVPKKYGIFLEMINWRLANNANKQIEEFFTDVS